MTRRSFFPLLVVALVGLVRPGAACAAECSVQRRDYAFNTYFELSQDAQPSGTILRQRWRQPFRSTYELFDPEGNAAGSASTRIFNLGVIFPWARTLDIKDVEGRRTHALRGVWFTADKAVFELKTRDGQLIANLRMDIKHSGCLASRPTDKHAILARLYRNQISDHNYERWDYVTRDNADVPAHVWQLIAAFFADVW